MGVCVCVNNRKVVVCFDFQALNKCRLNCPLLVICHRVAGKLVHTDSLETVESSMSLWNSKCLLEKKSSYRCVS